MKKTLLRLYVKGQSLWSVVKEDERGQDLVEYALVLALVALAATAGMNTLAGDINTAMSNIGGKLTTYTT